MIYRINVLDDRGCIAAFSYPAVDYKDALSKLFEDQQLGKPMKIFRITLKSGEQFAKCLNVMAPNAIAAKNLVRKHLDVVLFITGQEYSMVNCEEVIPPTEPRVLV